MSVHVIIKRKWQIGKPSKLFPLLRKLRDQASKQPGYLSSHTLRNHVDSKYFLVIGRWETIKDWNKWLGSKKRQKLQGKVDSLIGEKTFYEIFEVVDDKGEVLPGERKKGKKGGKQDKKDKKKKKK
jgi:heme-degrading monooxygenase HmoA